MPTREGFSLIAWDPIFKKYSDAKEAAEDACDNCATGAFALASNNLEWGDLGGSGKIWGDLGRSGYPDNPRSVGGIIFFGRDHKISMSNTLYYAILSMSI